MKSLKLFLEIKKGLEQYKSKLKYDPEDIVKNSSIGSIMSKYNRDNFNEIMSLSLDKLDDNEILDKEVDDFKNRIDYFFSLYGGENEDFKEFIKLISLYLVFIAKKPLYPPGIQFSNGNKVYKKDNVYYCTGKTQFIKENLSLCKYCICSQINH